MQRAAQAGKAGGCCSDTHAQTHSSSCGSSGSSALRAGGGCCTRRAARWWVLHAPDCGCCTRFVGAARAASGHAAAPAPAGTAGPLADDGFAAEFGAPAAATLAKEDVADATAPAPARIAACQAAAIAAFFCDCCCMAEAEALGRVEGNGTAVLAALLAATAALAAVIWL